MIVSNRDKCASAVFITFSGNCREALAFYQTCFGGSLLLEPFETEWQGHPEKPIVIGSLFSDSITIYGSDLVYNEGRKVGNYMAVFLHCKTVGERQSLIEKLGSGTAYSATVDQEGQKLVEIIDMFEVRWILAM
ncbi:VOC family protein [Sphingobacterium arenae]|uniref:Glyoxalase n=1 Tax=Sphingobacterium arenae TaxID=1280598 RepID=A0ABR7Y3Y8_9SPHI|nr:glyoxalase [Sphingobacterium arenae]MBD1426024.1 glyoxalase [Sphingobacterium arenae]